VERYTIRPPGPNTLADGVLGRDNRSDPDIAGYYRDSVIGRTGTFILTVHAPQDFESAILEKLLREIALVRVQSPEQADGQVSRKLMPGENP
jgi:hypothetical protein